MSVCPRCGRVYVERPALSRKDNKTYICPDCGTEEALDAAGLTEGSAVRDAILGEVSKRRESPQKRVERAVHASGNKWSIENFHSTHD